MVKFFRFLVLAVLLIWLVGSGCIGKNEAEMNKTGAPSSVEAKVQPTENLETGLTQAEIQELDSDMEDLENLLENTSLHEEIQIEEL